MAKAQTQTSDERMLPDEALADCWRAAQGWVDDCDEHMIQDLYLAGVQILHLKGHIAALAKQLEQAEALLDCRAGKLLKRGTRFVVVAVHEKYFGSVFNTIRESEKEAGNWTHSDQRWYIKAMQEHIARLPIEVPHEAVSIQRFKQAREQAESKRDALAKVASDLAGQVEQSASDLLGQQDEVEDLKLELTARAERIAALRETLEYIAGSIGKVSDKDAARKAAALDRKGDGHVG